METSLAVVRLVMGAGLVLVGILSALYPYKIARIEEMIDAIGSTRQFTDVEPADWKVTVTRIGGFVLIVFGLLWSLPGLALLP